MDNLPQVPPEKQEKLAAVIKRLYAQIGTIREGTGATRLIRPPVCFTEVLICGAWYPDCRRILDALR